MNYTIFFVVLSTIGAVVFVGIFGAAWMSAADQPTRGVNTIPVNPQTPKPSPEAPDNLTIEATNETPSNEVSSEAATTQVSFINSEENDHSSTPNPSSAENSEASTEKNSEPSTAANPEAVTTKNSGPTTAETFKTTDGARRMVPGPSSNGISPTELPCTFEKLTDEKGEIKPSYENENSCHQWLVEYEKGYSVDLTIDRIDLDVESSDYLLISPDENTTGDEGNPVFSWALTEKRYYKIPYKGTAYILFVTHKSENPDGKPRGFRIIYSRSGELTTTLPTSTGGPIPAPEDSIYISVEFSGTVQEQIILLRNALANEANTFCEENNIILNARITYENVLLTEQQRCLATWPNSDRCYTFNMAIPVDTKNTTYELSKEHLQNMWDEWNDEGLVGIKKTNGPNYKKHVLIWFLLSIVFIILFSVCLLFLWQWQLNNTLKSEESITRESQAIEVPPFFEYMDSRYDDPEYLPYADSMYDMGTETSTDDRFSYGALPPYSKRPSNVSTFQFGRPSNAGIDNKAFIEEDEEEYEIMNRASITKEAKKVDNEL